MILCRRHVRAHLNVKLHLVLLRRWWLKFLTRKTIKESSKIQQRWLRIVHLRWILWSTSNCYECTLIKQLERGVKVGISLLCGASRKTWWQKQMAAENRSKWLWATELGKHENLYNLPATPVPNTWFIYHSIYRAREKNGDVKTGWRCYKEMAQTETQIQR